MKYRWEMRQAQEDAVDRLARELNDLPRALARALVLRGIDTFDAARTFFRPTLDQLHDPFLMKDMDAAADRVARAVQGGERVMVYGDYDVDGTTATALMTHFLRTLGVEAEYFIPHRTKDGYGLGQTGIDAAADARCTLIVALDCGITALDTADYARERGLDLIICDHHLAGDTIPDAVAVLDPKRPDCSYPFKELSGCALGYKLACATLIRLGRDTQPAHAYLDLVALSTASDIVPLYGENRVLMRYGLERLARTERPGLRALAESASLELPTVDMNGIVFRLGPRINAAGRMDSAGLAVDVMLSDDDAEARALAAQLEQANSARQEIDRATRDAAERMAEIQMAGRHRHGLVLYDAAWHPGVIGIVASRVVERFYRPTVMLTQVGDVVKGSARSVAGINIHECLGDCAEHLIQFGGHDFAAGMSLRVDALDAFRRAFDEAVGARASADTLVPVQRIDAALDLRTLDLAGRHQRFWNVLRQFAPHGPDNGTVIFRADDVRLQGAPRTVGQGGAHLKLRVRTAGMPLDVIGFGLGEHAAAIGDGAPLSLAFSIEENHWNGRTTLQLRARDVKVGA